MAGNTTKKLAVLIDAENVQPSMARILLAEAAKYGEEEAERVPIESPDLTTAVVRLPERLIFIASVYVGGGNAPALDGACNHLRNAVTKVRRDTGTVVEVLIMGDFNQHDQLWGGDDVSVGRQGEADPIIDLMNELSLSSLLKRGTKTWHGAGQSGDCESTIDIILASEKLTDSIVKCDILGTEHGSDHCAIETVFDALWSPIKHQERLLLKTLHGKTLPWLQALAGVSRTLPLIHLETYGLEIFPISNPTHTSARLASILSPPNGMCGTILYNEPSNTWE